MARDRCPVCKAQKIVPIYDFGVVPFTTELPIGRTEVCNTSELEIFGCAECGFVFNKNVVDPVALYSGCYNLTSCYAAQHTGRLVELLSEKIPDKSSFIFEIASNDGAFLRRFIDKGYVNCLGIEPSDNCCRASSEKGVEAISELFSLKSAENISDIRGKADLIIIRHAIEHIAYLDDFIDGIDLLCADDGVVYIEFPENEQIFEYGKYMYYFEQHVNYFTEGTLNNLMKRYNFKIEGSYFFTYGGGATGVLYTRGVAESKEEEQIVVSEIKANLYDIIEAVVIFFAEFPDSLFALYGPGFVGLSLINNLHLTERFCCAFDDNPVKIGRYLPGALIPIISGSELLAVNPDYCIIAPLNEKSFEDNIISKNQAYLSKGGKFIRMYPGNEKQPVALMQIVSKDSAYYIHEFAENV